MSKGTATAYDRDIVAWANEQAALLRAGQFAELDIEHIAEEIEDVGKSEQRELASRLAVLLAHLLKWQYQPARRGASWQATIREQRKTIGVVIRKTPSLKNSLVDEDWLTGVWGDALTKAIEETGLVVFPENCPWPMEKVLSQEFYPE
jgi:ribosomal protein L29